MKRVFLLLGVPVVLLAVTLFQGKRPYYNWDIFPYMALAASDGSVPFNEVHALVYEEAARQMPPQDFEAIAQRQPGLRQNSNAFHDILKYYEIKPAYIGLVRILQVLGVNLVVATYIPSLAAYFLLGCLLFVLMNKIMRIEFAALATLLLAASPFLLDTARYSSPDMLCALLLVGGVFLITEISIVAGLVLCVVSILVRPDAVVFITTLTAALYRTRKIGLITLLVLLVLAFVLTLIIMGGPSSIFEYVFTTADYDPSWNLSAIIQNYLAGLRMGLKSVINSQTALFTLAGLLALYLRKKSGSKLHDDLWSLLVIGSILTILLRYFIHPIIEDRFQIASYLVIFIGFCKIIAAREVSKSNSSLSQKT